MFHPDEMTITCAAGFLCHNCLISCCHNVGKQIIRNSGGLIPNISCNFQTIPSICRTHYFWKDKGNNIVIERPKLYMSSFEVSHFKWKWSIRNIQRDVWWWLLVLQNNYISGDFYFIEYHNSQLGVSLREGHKFKAGLFKKRDICSFIKYMCTWTVGKHQFQFRYLFRLPTIHNRRRLWVHLTYIRIYFVNHIYY